MSTANAIAIKTPDVANKQAIAFFDGQNLFHRAKELFGYHFPNYDPLKLATKICGQQGWSLKKTKFYTGIPDQKYDWIWNQFWQNKLRPLGRLGVDIFTRKLVYRTDVFTLDDGEEVEVDYEQEKGIDVRIAVDIIRCVYNKSCDVVLIFSQDQDLSEATAEAKVIAVEQGRPIEIASAYPFDGSGYTAAIGGTVSIKIDRGTYDACIDPRDYRPPSANRYRR